MGSPGIIGSGGRATPAIERDNSFHLHRHRMLAADLGIIDQNLDEKIGMEPPCVFLPLMRKPSNPLDGTRLWDNS